MARRAVSVIAAAVLASLLSGPDPGRAASAADGDGVLQASYIDADLQAYAEHYGVSAARAVDEYATFSHAAELEQRLIQALPDSFAGLWIAHRPFGVKVAVSGSLDEARSLVAGSAIGNQVDIELVERSLKDLQALAATTTPTGADPIDVEIDIHTNRVLVSTTDKARTQARLQANAGLAVREVRDLIRPSADIYGGVTLSGCTAGFTVRNSGGTTGIATAAHCGNTQSYTGINLPYVTGRQYHNVDTQWHTTPGLADVGKFKSGATTTRNVTGQATYAGVPTGAWICKYGKETGHRCGELTSKSISPSYVPKGGMFGRITKCDTDLATPGDSGGPVFNGGIAVGIHSGQYNDVFCGADQAIFGFIEFVTQWLDIRAIRP